LLSAQQRIVFKTGKIPAPIVSNGHIHLAGSFNNWNPADTAWELHTNNKGECQLMKTLPAGVYEFKITRGSWQTVECAVNGKSIDNRHLSVSHDTTLTLNIAGWHDSFAPTGKVHTASPQVHIINEKFDIPQLSRQRRIWIYLPADYGLSKRKYPVIYMNDGQNLFDAYTSGFGEWGIDEILDKMPTKEQSIVVGIDHGGEYRMTEYNAYESKFGKGRGDDYVDFIAKTLKPYIDKHYNTKPGARQTTIAGSSMGGLISMYAALKYSGVFGNAGVFSPSFWIAPDMYEFAKKKNVPVNSRFYFVCGDAESESMVTDMKKMADIILAKTQNRDNAPVVIIKGAGHNEKQWNGDFPGFYAWLIKGF